MSIKVEFPSTQQATQAANIRLFTVDQVATETGLSKRAVYRATWEQGLPVVRLGSHVRIRESDLVKWLDAKTEVCV